MCIQSEKLSFFGGIRPIVASETVDVWGQSGNDDYGFRVILIMDEEKRNMLNR